MNWRSVMKELILVLLSVMMFFGSGEIFVVLADICTAFQGGMMARRLDLLPNSSAVELLSTVYHDHQRLTHGSSLGTPG